MAEIIISAENINNLLQEEDHKYTRKDLFIFTRTLLEDVEAADADIMNIVNQAIDMCNKYVGQLEKPAKPRINEKAIMFAAECYKLMGQHLDETMEDAAGVTAGQIADWYNAEHPVDPENIDDKPVSVQKVTAAMRRLTAEGKVIKIEGKKMLYKVAEVAHF